MIAYKRPEDMIPLGYDFSLDLPIGRTIQSADVRVKDAVTHDDVTSRLLFRFEHTQNSIDAAFQWGEDMQDYIIVFIARLQGPLEMRATVMLRVRDNFEILL